MLNLGSPPAWAASKPDLAGPYGMGCTTPPRDIKDWEDYVRQQIPLGWLELDGRLAPAWRRFLATRRYNDIGRYNAAYGANFAGFDEVPFWPRRDDRVSPLSHYRSGGTLAAFAGKRTVANDPTTRTNAA